MGDTKRVDAGCTMTAQDFQELAMLTDTAEDCLQSLRFGSHYALKLLMKNKHGIITTSREDTIKKARTLCDEYITAQLTEEK